MSLSKKPPSLKKSSNRDPVESGEWVDPYGKAKPTKKPATPAQAKKKVDAAKASARKLDARLNKLLAKTGKGTEADAYGPKSISKKSLAEIKKMPKKEMQKAFIDKGGVVDFKGNKKAEMKIGLRDLFGAETPLILIRDKDENSFYAERKKNGHYYKPGTSQRVFIFTGYSIDVPDAKNIAKYKKEAGEEGRGNRRLAARARMKTQRKKEKVIAKYIEDMKDKVPKEGILVLIMAMKNSGIEKKVRKIIEAKGLKGKKSVKDNPLQLVAIHKELINSKGNFFSIAYVNEYNGHGKEWYAKIVGSQNKVAAKKPKTKKEAPKVARADTRQSSQRPPWMKSRNGH